MEKETIEELRAILRSSKRPVFLGGAGVSTASGIPDFRSEEGIYKTVKKYRVTPEEILSHRFFFEHPETFYDFYWSTMIYPDALPNLAHEMLAKWSDKSLLFVITQNIDGLHEKAHTKRVIPVHGSVERYTCPTCGKKMALTDLAFGEVPRCPCCQDVLKPDVTLYGEMLDEEALMQAQGAIAYADLLIIGGTSLLVYPVNDLPRFFRGKTLVIINKGETPLDAQADYVIHEDLGETLKVLLEGIA